MKKRWWWYALVLLVIDLAVAGFATRFNHKEFLSTLAYVSVVVFAIGVVLPLTASAVAAWHRRATRQSHPTAAVILGFLAGALFTAPLVIALGFKALDAMRKHGL